MKEKMSCSHENLENISDYDHELFLCKKCGRLFHEVPIMNTCLMCGKDVMEEHTIFKYSKVLKGGICPDCYLSYPDRELSPPSWREKNRTFYF